MLNVSKMQMSHAWPWYKNAAIYQIYPRSFADSNNDGTGDLQGIRQRLDYLVDLGVTAIWLSPIYSSPMLDFGYDVSDYERIDHIFGNLHDFDELVSAARAKNLKIIMDFVLNQTSDEHAWFQESKSALANPKRDWYIWKDPKPDGSPPNNWESVFGGSAWEFDPATKQYYLHSFLKQQPDLNWANPEVRQAIQQIMRFWFDRGVDGFRVDAFPFVAKDQSFADRSYAKNGPVGQLFPLDASGFGAHFTDYSQELTSVAHEYPDRYILYEADPTTQRTHPSYYLKWYDHCDVTAAAPFYFGLLAAVERWGAQSFRDYVEALQLKLPSGATPVYVLGNHDVPRLASRVGEHGARLAAMALVLLPGARVIYDGDELGMEDAEIAAADRQDTGKDALGTGHSRDPERTPMQWSSARFAGFSTHKPWLPIGADYHTHNVEVMSADSRSILNLYRRLLQLCRQLPALQFGSYGQLNVANPDVFGYTRSHNDQTIAVLLNFSDRPVTFTPPFSSGKLIVSTEMDVDGGLTQPDTLTLRPHEGWAVEVRKG